MSKEGSSVEETQDMGGGWCTYRDQAQGRSHGFGRPHVCAEFLTLGTQKLRSVL